jgi:hypothetical protein
MVDVTGALPGTKVCQQCGDAARELIASQQRLGREFEAVLFANLWQLYSR